MTGEDKIFANTLFIKDLEASELFYREVFDKTPIYRDKVSIVFQFGELLLNFLLEKEAEDLISPRKVASEIHGSRFQLTIKVADVDTQAKRLHALGIPLINGPMDRPWGIRTLLFSDPNGHLWEFAHEITQ